MVNQQYIADRLNISRTTVSRSLTNHPAINPETRARVLSLAAQLGYRPTPPRAPRKNARRQDLSTLGVLIGMAAARVSATDAFQYMLRGISEKAAARRLSLSINYLDPATFAPETMNARALKALGGDSARGVILIYSLKPPAVQALTRHLSAVSIVEDYSETGVDCIDTDQTGGIGEIVRHLVELGHRRIGFATWTYTVDTPWALRRFGAYVESLFRHGLEFNPAWALNVRQDARHEIADLPPTVARLVRQERVTAWVCAADHQGYALIAELERLGLRVPHDCSVTGFDGIEPPPGFPALTTLKVPYENMGAAAVVRLLDRIEHPASPRRHILVAGRPIFGATTARPSGMP